MNSTDDSLPCPPAPEDGGYTLRLHPSPGDVDARDWDALLAAQPHPTPFMRHAYLSALDASGSAVPETGWTPVFCTLWRGGALVAACAVYAKPHSYGEYVFDHAWAQAYARHGVAYYPKAVVAVPFTPVPGARLLAVDAGARAALVRALVQWCTEAGLSSLHLLFAAPEDLEAARAAGLMLRQTVQFHWRNAAPATGRPFGSFDDFLATLSQDKRKKIRQERRRVADAGVAFRWARGADIAPQDWDFFYRCYERTYWEHGNPPYLSRDFFHRMEQAMPEAWLLFIAERGGQPIASSLIAIHAKNTATCPPDDPETVAYGRYWGALERVDCLHFEACYYQPLQWCIAHGVGRFEGGAQGEHKMARALMPVATASAHWLAHPGFAEAVDRFLEREGEGVEGYLDALRAHSPFKAAGGDAAG
ncbi:GNAT family N-acetyltransferase [Paracidovorax anthurii]|uniref:GNAT family N-acetyltransferase n=1 Tax=Paracidovorax anthurii TaxID=78229 RepID=UPI000DCF803F|nr:GNAT family N-acetyltransferase [Paracidovorax anthurii]